jgi:TPP-dependent indolepyruvate ferredoxin oxidoreductase alpha subunit
MTYPLPLERIRAFAAGVERCVVIEEGDPYLVEASAPPASRWRASRRCTASAS